MMTSEMIERAVDALGEQQANDYIINPDIHAETLAPQAPALGSLLRLDSLKQAAKTFERLDGDAGKAQVEFKRSVGRANLAVFLSALFSAATVVAGVLNSILGASATSVLLVICGVGALGCGAAATFYIFQVREGRLLETWMTRRADAEAARLAYFNSAVLSSVEAHSDIPLLLLQLEYVRRFQLDVQIIYYRDRGKQHAKSAKQTLLLGGTSAGIAAFSAGAASALGLVDVALTALGSLGVFGTALASYATAREATNQDRRNAERYERTLTALEQVKGKLGAVRAAAADGNKSLVLEFVAAIHEQLSLEHRQWRDSGESSESAAARLERALEDIKTAAKPAGSE